MGQFIYRLYYEDVPHYNYEKDPHLVEKTGSQKVDKDLNEKFPDLTDLPPELSLLVLSNLKATDLCLASCVWQKLADDQILWQGLCRDEWGYSSAYSNSEKIESVSFKRLYMELDEATLTFNADPELGLEYLLSHQLVENDAFQLAQFLHNCQKLDSSKKREFLNKRADVLDQLVALHNFRDQFLPNALRQFFTEAHPPDDRGAYLHRLVDLFSSRFCACNPQLGFTRDSVYIVCFSLIILSVDLSSPAVKNKMSKREFIRNTRHAVNDVNAEFAGHLYDNIYLAGHVAPLR